jgi:serine/threonine protein kinase
MEEKKLIITTPHTFKLKHFNTPTWCRFCTKFIWGLGKQGYQCKICKYPAHIKCVKLIPETCCINENNINIKKDITRSKFENFKDLIIAMKNPKTGIPIKERWYRLRLYACFLGSEAVDWMIQNLPIRDREEAISLGNNLIQNKYIKHVSEDHKRFEDKDYYYLFNDPAIIEQEENKDQEINEINITDFEIIELIGKGGFGVVSKVKKKDSNKIFAMKTINKIKIKNQKQFQYLISEKKVMLNDNPFLVHLHYSFQTEDKLYFVMDYISGGDLATHLTQVFRFSEKEIRFFSAEIVLALDYLHSCGFIYRDLKLENILLDKDGHICLTDFGLSKELREASSTTKTVCGTPTYLAPEILMGQPYGNSVDWWSLGIVIYELFSGENPFEARDLDSVLQNILFKTIFMPSFISPVAQDLIFKLLQKDPKKRLCSGPNGSSEIRDHPFFKDVNWKNLMLKKEKSPYIPKINQQNIDNELKLSSENINEEESLNLKFQNFTYVDPFSAKIQK